MARMANADIMCVDSKAIKEKFTGLIRWRLCQIFCFALLLPSFEKKSHISSVLLAGSKMFVRLKSTRWIWTSHIDLGTLLELWLYPEVENYIANNICFLLLLPTMVMLISLGSFTSTRFSWWHFFDLYTFNLIYSLFGLVNIFGWLEKLRSFLKWFQSFLSVMQGHIIFQLRRMNLVLFQHKV